MTQDELEAKVNGFQGFIDSTEERIKALEANTHEPVPVASPEDLQALADRVATLEKSKKDKTATSDDVQKIADRVGTVEGKLPTLATVDAFVELSKRVDELEDASTEPESEEQTAAPSATSGLTEADRKMLARHGIVPNPELDDLEAQQDSAKEEAEEKSSSDKPRCTCGTGMKGTRNVNISQLVALRKKCPVHGKSNQ